MSREKLTQSKGSRRRQSGQLGLEISVRCHGFLYLEGDGEGRGFVGYTVGKVVKNPGFLKWLTRVGYLPAVDSSDYSGKFLVYVGVYTLCVGSV